MSRRKTPAPPAPTTTTDTMLSEIFQSEEYRESLKARILSGVAKSSELQLARSLGFRVPTDSNEEVEREAMRRMPLESRRAMTDGIRLFNKLKAEVLAGDPPVVYGDVTTESLMP